MMHNEVQSLPLEVVWHTLWHFAGEGVQPGSFIGALLNAMARADQQNLYRLALGFPEYADAWRLVTETPGGLQLLRDIAKAARS